VNESARIATDSALWEISEIINLIIFGTGLRADKLWHFIHSIITNGRGSRHKLCLLARCTQACTTTDLCSFMIERFVLFAVCL
jgi:hypothetical protein